MMLELFWTLTLFYLADYEVSQGSVITNPFYSVSFSSLRMHVFKTGLPTLPLLHAQRDDMSTEIILVPVQICVNRISVIFNSGLILTECRL
jgi:hypothetical protein